MNRIGIRISYNHIFFLYVSGIIISLIIAFLPFSQIDRIKVNIVSTFGVTHVILLSLLGYKLVKKSELIKIGQRIQTAGYLYTLIGFAISLSLIKSNFQISDLSLPLSGALITSIIGWFVGGEIVAKGEENKTKDLIESTLSEIEKYSRLILETQKNNLKFIENSYEKHFELINEIHQNHHLGIVESYKDQNKTIKDIQNEFSVNSGKLSKSILNFSKELNNIYSSLNTQNKKTKSSLNQLSSLVNRFNNNIETSLKSQEEVTLSLKKSQSLIADNYKLLSEEGKKASQGLKKVSENAIDASDKVGEWAKMSNNSISLINQLISETENLINYVVASRK